MKNPDAPPGSTSRYVPIHNVLSWLFDFTYTIDTKDYVISILLKQIRFRRNKIDRIWKKLPHREVDDIPQFSGAHNYTLSELDSILLLGELKAEITTLETIIQELRHRQPLRATYVLQWGELIVGYEKNEDGNARPITIGGPNTRHLKGPYTSKYATPNDSNYKLVASWTFEYDNEGNVVGVKVE